MNENVLKEQAVTLPKNYEILESSEIDQIMSDLGPFKKMTAEECRELMDKQLGEDSLSDAIVEIRREARY